MMNQVRRMPTPVAIGCCIVVLLPAAYLLAQDTTDTRIAHFVEQLKGERTALNALRELEDIGPEVAPQLVRAYRTPDAHLRFDILCLLLGNGSDGVPPLVSALKDETALIREDAAVGLGLLATHGWIAGFNPMGSHDENAIPALVETLKNAVPALIETLKDQNVGVRNHAIDALRAIGPNALDALPVLLEIMKDENSGLGDRAVIAIGQLGSAATPAVERLLQNPSEVLRSRGAVALRKIQVAELIEQLKDKDTWPHSVPALLDMGSDAVVPLLRVIEREWAPFEGMRPQARIPIFADDILRQIGKDAVPPLVAALHDDNALLRKLAAEELGGLGRYAKEAEPEIRKAAEKGAEEDAVPWFVRGTELETILDLKVALRKQAVPALLGALHDADRSVCASAIRALGGVGTTAPEVLPALLVMLRDEDHGVGAAYTLARLGPIAVPGLVEALGHEDPLVRDRAAKGLARIGPDAKDAVPALIRALEGEDGAARAMAAHALAMIGPQAKQAVQPLIALSGNSDLHVRSTAMIALGMIGSEAKQAVPGFIEALQDGDLMERMIAVKALDGIGRDAVDAVPALIGALTDENMALRGHAAEALAKIGPGAKAAVPALTQILRDAESSNRPYAESVRPSAVRALGEIGPEAKEAVPYLIRVLTISEDAALEHYAREYLGETGPNASATVPVHIAKVQRDRHAQLRAAAAAALGKVGPGAKEAVPALTEALEDRNEWVRNAAARALRRIRPDEQAP